ncbi:MAG: peptide chain release factor 1 [Candidatus Omnitrophica bacterium]|nr:peptide chain release factor 1 [Candidatus Omnitrophota bacterium]
MFDRLERFEKRYLELESLLGAPEVVSNKEQYNKYAKELSDLQGAVFLFRDFKKTDNELQGLEKVVNEKHDKEFLDMVRQELVDLKEKKVQLEARLKKLLAGEDKDLNKDVIMEIRQGTGGEEAALFASVLYRMYTQYAANKGWKTELLSSSPTELGGFKEVIFSLSGKEAYKRLKFESGVHRVQRVPSTEAQGRIHTSTATVAILAEAQEVDLVIEPKDLRIDTYRSSGPGGQHMQKTDSAVRITHIPTGTVVACQDERSQIKNKNKAMRILRARILAVKKEEESKKLTRERKSQIGTGDRSEKIRTYNFPDRRITDHRINFTVHQLEAVLDGDLEELSNALLKAAEEKQAKG